MWYHSSGNSLSVFTWHSHIGKLGSKFQGHPSCTSNSLLPSWWSAWVSRKFQTEWHAPKYKYFLSWKTTSTYWQSLYYFHVVWIMTHGHHQCTDHGNPLLALSSASCAERNISHWVNFLFCWELRWAQPLVLSKFPLGLGYALSTTFHSERNSSQVRIVLSALVSLSEMSKCVILKILTVKVWRRGLRTYSPDLKAIQRLTNLGSRFYRNMFR